MCKFMCLKGHSVIFLKRRLCCHHLKIKSRTFSASYDGVNGIGIAKKYLWNLDKMHKTTIWRHETAIITVLQSLEVRYLNWVPPSPISFPPRSFFWLHPRRWSPDWEWLSHWAEQTHISVWGSKAAEYEGQAKLEKGDPWRMKPRILPGYFR